MALLRPGEEDRYFMHEVEPSSSQAFLGSFSMYRRSNEQKMRQFVVFQGCFDQRIILQKRQEDRVSEGE